MNWIRDYWEDRASSDSSAQATTGDVYLRKIEQRVLADEICALEPLIVADLGCGDGRTTLSLAKQFPQTKFIGYDYAEAMIGIARTLRQTVDSNVDFQIHDATSPLPFDVDLVYSTRCLINLPSWELQKAVLLNVWKSLPLGGVYIAIENFIEGQDSFNEVRTAFGLPKIPVRDHNLFFNRVQLVKFLDGLFTIENEINISSTYYLVSRIHYSRACADAGTVPDYHDKNHENASKLPFAGEFGPVRMMRLRKV